MSEAGKERRRDIRLQAKLGVRYKVGKKIAKGTSIDLSENGVFIHTSSPAQEGSEVFMHINLGPGEPTIKAVGVVRRMIPAGIDDPGMGVEFQALYGIDKKALLRFLQVSLGREIDEDDFGTLSGKASESGQDVLKFVFEPDDDFAYEGTSPAAEPAQPLELARKPVPRPSRWAPDMDAPPPAPPLDPREIPVPDRTIREITRNHRAFTEKDKRNLAELKKLEPSFTGRALWLLMKWSLIGAAIAGAIWAFSHNEGIQRSLDQLLNK